MKSSTPGRFHHPWFGGVTTMFQLQYVFIYLFELIFFQIGWNALSLHARQSGSKKKVKANWINVMVSTNCNFNFNWIWLIYYFFYWSVYYIIVQCPFQSAYTKYGYYVLKYMKVVVEGLEVFNNNVIKSISYLMDMKCSRIFTYIII